MEHIVYTIRNYEKPSPFLKKFLGQWQSPAKKGQIEPKGGINVSVSYWLMIWATFYILKSLYSISIYNQPVNLHKIIMIFSVSNDGIQWTLDFGPDSVTISVKDLD